MQFLLLGALALWRPAHRWTLPTWVDVVVRIVGLFGLVWLVLGAASLGRSLTAVPLPRAGASLRVGGLYRLSRHPIYTGLLALAWSWAIGRESAGPIALAGALTAVLATKARFEEGALREVYPDYAAYAARTPRFWPIGPALRLGARSSSHDGSARP